MIDDLPRGERVKRHGVALGASPSGERRVDRWPALKGPVEMPGTEQCRRLAAAGTRGMTVTPDRVPPREDVARIVQVGFDVDDHRGPERRPREVVGARPLHTYRAAIGSEREPGRVERDIVGAIVSVAAGARDMLDDDFILRNA